MSEIAACTLIQEEPDRKTERYLMMFKDYPDVVSVDILQEMLGICRKNAYLGLLHGGGAGGGGGGGW